MRAIIVAAGLLIGFQQSAAIAGEIVCSDPGILLECTLPDNVQMNFRLIEPESDADPESFYIGTTEITQRQWEAVTGDTPWAGRGNVAVPPEDPEDPEKQYPATYISWTNLSIEPHDNCDPDESDDCDSEDLDFCDRDDPEDPDCNLDSFPAEWRTMGSGYEARLPTQIEWEYACLAKLPGPWSFAYFGAKWPLVSV